MQAQERSTKLSINTIYLYALLFLIHNPFLGGGIMFLQRKCEITGDFYLAGITVFANIPKVN